MAKAMQRMDPNVVAQNPGVLAQYASDPQLKAMLEAGQLAAEGRGAAAAGQPFDAAAYMKKLGQTGLIDHLPTLDADDARLQPIDGMSFDEYISLAASELLKTGPADPGPAFHKWSTCVVADRGLGMHYSKALQEELGRQRATPRPAVPPQSP